MTKILKLRYKNLPTEWDGFPVRYRIMNNSLERIEDGVLVLSESVVNLKTKKQLSTGRYALMLTLPSGQSFSNNFEVKPGIDPVVPVFDQISIKKDMETYSLFSLPASGALTESRGGVESKRSTKPILKPKLELSLYGQANFQDSLHLSPSALTAKIRAKGADREYNIRGRDNRHTQIGVFKTGKSILAVVLPPATSESPDSNLRLDCTWNSRTHGSARKLSVSVNMENRAAQSLLGYMRIDDIDSAEVVGKHVVKQAHEMFRDKYRDVSAACVAAYFLIKISEWEELPSNWCDNIYRSFPHIADGAVIKAYKEISKLPKKPKAAELKLIGNVLIEATSRGLPIFSFGVRLLNDALIALTNSLALAKVDRDNEDFQRVERARNWIHKYLSHCDFSNSFTTLIFDKKEQFNALMNQEVRLEPSENRDVRRVLPPETFSRLRSRDQLIKSKDNEAVLSEIGFRLFELHSGPYQVASMQTQNYSRETALQDGRRVFRMWNEQLFHFFRAWSETEKQPLMVGTLKRDEQFLVFTVSEVMVKRLGGNPAIAIPVATLIARNILEADSPYLFDAWEESLRKR